MGVVENKSEPELAGEVECDAVYIVAGHKGKPDSIKKKGRKPRRNRLKGARGRNTLEKEKPPVFGMTQRSGEVVIRRLKTLNKRLSSL